MHDVLTVSPHPVWDYFITIMFLIAIPEGENLQQHEGGYRQLASNMLGCSCLLLSHITCYKDQDTRSVTCDQISTQDFLLHSCTCNDMFEPVLSP